MKSLMPCMLRCCKPSQLQSLRSGTSTATSAGPRVAATFPVHVSCQNCSLLSTRREAMHGQLSAHDNSAEALPRGIPLWLHLDEATSKRCRRHCMPDRRDHRPSEAGLPERLFQCDHASKLAARMYGQALACKASARRRGNAIR